MSPTEKLETWTLTRYLLHNFPPADDIVAGLIGKGEMIVCSATAKTGKSLLATNLALCAARGVEPFLGHFAVQKTRVLLIQTEISSWQFQNRLFTMMKRWNEKMPLLDNFVICETRFRLDRADGIQRLFSLCEELQTELLILDPLYTLHQVDEDKAKEITPVLYAIKEVAHKLNMGCLVIHHQGKKHESDGRQVGHRHRGSSAIADVPDGSLSFQRTSTEKQAVLSGELRNHESPSNLILQIDEFLWWSCINVGSLGNQKPTYSLKDMLGENEFINRGELIQRFMNTYDRGERTAQQFISEMIRGGKIFKSRVPNGEAIYSRTSSECKTAAPYKDCTLAEGETPNGR
jgi:hypothetical protein